MDSDTPKPSIQELQSSVVELLRQVSELMGRASTDLSSDSSGKMYAELKDQIANEANKVEKLRLNMAVVAPMKAGKSTIINAIAGQEILPSRNSAMTTLPTEVIFYTKPEPYLELSSESDLEFNTESSSNILNFLMDICPKLNKRIEEIGKDKINQKTTLSSQRDVLELLETLKNVSFSTHSKISGSENIVKILTDLNDIVRLCRDLDPSLLDPLQRITDIPRIYTPFWRSQKEDLAKALGNLVIVDTPGPNEAGENFRLQNIVDEQLKDSSMVLLVLDFTQLDTEAAEKVKTEVQKIIDLRGQENLYVLVNKVDQRRDDDGMTPEQVQQFVASKLGIGESNTTDRVFEISARRALYATKFLLEIQQNPNADIVQMEIATVLAQELYSNWKQKLKKLTVEDLENEAKELWENSGFATFLEKAIDILMIEAAPRCIKAALNTARESLKKLHDYTELRRSAISQDAEKIQQEIHRIDKDLNELERSRQYLDEVDRIRENLNKNIKEIINYYKKEAQLKVGDYFVEEELEQAKQSGDFLKQTDIAVREYLLKDLPHTENIKLPLPKLSQNIKAFMRRGRENKFEFESEEEAENFLEQAVKFAKQKTIVLLDKARKKVEGEIEKSINGLTDFVEKEIKPIVARACDRLNENFNVNLSLPPLILEGDDINFKKLTPTKSTRLKEEYDEKIVKKRRWWTLWLFRVEAVERVKIQKELNCYVVFLDKLLDEFNESLEINIKNLKIEINQYLDEDFQQRIDKYTKELKKYLLNYQGSLKQAEEDQKLSQEELEELTIKLDSLIPDTTEQIKKIDERLFQLNSSFFGESRM